MNELRFAFRQLRKSPGFTSVVVLTLAVAIGATSMLFSLIQGAYLTALPYPRSRDIVTLSAQAGGSDEMEFSEPEFAALRERSHTLQNVTALAGGSFNLGGEGDAVRLRGLRATASLFRMLETEPLLGRVFKEEEQTPGRDRVVVISYQLWQDALGGASNVVGHQLRLNDMHYTIVGVMPPRFRYGDNDLWVPLSLGLDGRNRATRNLFLHGRLAPNETLVSANAELATLAPQLRHDLGSAPGEADWSLRATPLIDDVVRDVKSALGILLGAVGCVLLIACSNISNLQLARNVLREKEMAVRLALGARRSDLVRQLLLESLLLALLGGTTGILVSAWSIGPLLRLIPYSYIPIEADVHLDWSVTCAALGVTVLTALLSGLWPAWKASAFHLSESLKETRGAAGSAGKHRRAQNFLVVAQIALTFVTLVGCVLMLKSFAQLEGVDPGFAPAQLTKFETALPAARYPDAAQVRRFYDRLLAKIRAIPGVRSASAVNLPPLALFPLRAPFSIAGRAVGSGAMPLAEQRQILPGYLSTLGISLLRGRDLSERDNAAALPVALINQTLANHYFPNRDPIGERIQVQENGQPGPWLTIVGLTKDVSQLRLSDPVVPEIYRPHAQAPEPSRRMAFVVRSSLGLTSLVDAVRTSLRAQDAEIPLFEAEPMQRLIDRSFGGQKLAISLLTLFGAVGLALTLIGIYGVTAYFVAHRRSEIGIRMALGAQRRNVLLLFLGEGAWLATIGIALGLVAALLATRLLRSMLFQVSSTDLVAYLVITLSLAAASLLACYFPARAATQLNPVDALRAE